jgi:hypothetical protein
MTFVTHSELEEIHAGMKRLISERKTLASHCVVVITKAVHFGDWRKEMWCTVCQARMELPYSEMSPLFLHKADCLVEKVMKEA